MFGHGETYRLIIRPPAGPVRVVERAASAVPVGRDERANWFEWFAYRASTSGQPNRYDVPSTKPIFRNLLSDHDSRIWVSLYAPAKKLDLTPRPEGDKRPHLFWQQPATYDVFSDQGDNLARAGRPSHEAVAPTRASCSQRRRSGCSSSPAMAQVATAPCAADGCVGARPVRAR